MWGASLVTDEGISHLAGLKKLKWIHIDNSCITDRSLEILSRLPALETLALQSNYFTDTGLSHLRGKTQVRSLWVGQPLAGTGITDEGVAFLAELPNLEELDLQNTKITAKSLEHLRGRLTKLKMLAIGGTHIDRLAVRHFRATDKTDRASKNRGSVPTPAGVGTLPKSLPRFWVTTKKI
ncbi:MAG TPA: hypothetical protein VHC22_34200 [Pirellulales bacterium]|nr:hypothetical protein [Pirellulales bacterium]